MKKTILLLSMMAAMMATLTSCEEEDDYIAQQLRDCDWQGYVGAYYSNRWGLSGSEYATVMRFTSKGEYYTSGRGEELDYDTRSPRNDYAYCTFKWFIVDGEITLIYDDDKWSPIYIIDYSLTSNRFRGYIRDYSSRRIQFDFESSSYGDWGYYSSRRGSYGGFSHQQYYHSRETTDAARTDFIDRSEEARQVSGESEAVSVASGSFARSMRER
ncbi:MAG: hypothetical protein II864_11735 [Prevotella sp.]|nr:hypothetical protein [Prevotella sp.]